MTCFNSPPSAEASRSAGIDRGRQATRRSSFCSGGIIWTLGRRWVMQLQFAIWIRNISGIFELFDLDHSGMVELSCIEFSMWGCIQATWWETRAGEFNYIFGAVYVFEFTSLGHGPTKCMQQRGRTTVCGSTYGELYWDNIRYHMYLGHTGFGYLSVWLYMCAFNRETTAAPARRTGRGTPRAQQFTVHGLTAVFEPELSTYPSLSFGSDIYLQLHLSGTISHGAHLQGLCIWRIMQSPSLTFVAVLWCKCLITPLGRLKMGIFRCVRLVRRVAGLPEHVPRCVGTEHRGRFAGAISSL